ncbi:MAG: FKBP-type peptidyl-prolyl cis-trans isomerase [Flavobacteriales bacterium]|jgi:peptidyl-prolyl cis-trans isomerase A (cyclophilin A)
MRTLLPFIALLFIAACKGKSPSPMTEQDMARAQKDLVEENRRQHNAEMKNIKEYIEKSGVPMEETSTGLHYRIYENGTGPKALKDEHVWIAYSIGLLDGTICYTADVTNPKHVHIGHDNVESGLHEALQLMRAGDKARFIFPSHLAFGFTGDSQKIPQNASVIYDIQLLRIEP